MEHLRRVALLIDTSWEYGRGLLRGVGRYMREHGPWSVYFESRGILDAPPPWLKDWQGDGILARINDRRMAAAVLHTGLPVVDTRGVLDDTGVPFVGVDNRVVAQRGIEHFLDRGIRHFGFCGLPPRLHVIDDRRQAEFVAQLRHRGFSCSVFPPPRSRRGRAAWDVERERMARWLVGLPKPVGVMVSYDDRGVQLLEACRDAGLAVPDQVAVVGIGNDPLVCEFANPPLTSIDLLSEPVGYEAAALLQRLMDGARPPRRPILLPPASVVARRSSEILASDDEAVVRAIRFIRGHACHGIHVSDVLREARLSRTVLKPRFKAVVGRTIHQEIHRNRIAQAQELLAGTDLPIKRISHRCGYHFVQYFIRTFKRTLDCTPAQYRRRFRSMQ